MKAVILTALALAPLSAEPAAPALEGVSGRYLEARTASVFAGACHYGSEYTTTGREAVAAWRLESGTVDGVSVAGVTVAALVVADRNLAAEESRHRSIAFVPPGLTDEVRRAALTWLRTEHGDFLGEVTEVRTEPLRFAFEDDRFDLGIGGDQSRASFELTGELMADRACCAMSHDVWYRPFDASVAQPIVGGADRFRGATEAFGRTWDDRDVNCAFSGRFGDTE